MFRGDEEDEEVGEKMKEGDFLLTLVFKFPGYLKKERSSLSMAPAFLVILSVPFGKDTTELSFEGSTNGAFLNL